MKRIRYLLIAAAALISTAAAAQTNDIVERKYWLDGDICIVEWNESCNLWTLTDDEESNPVQVSHWMPLPVPPMEEDHDAQ